MYTRAVAFREHFVVLGILFYLKMSAKFQFSSEEDEILVELIAIYPALYDASHADYKDYMIKENIWKEVSEKVRRSGEYLIVY